MFHFSELIQTRKTVVLFAAFTSDYAKNMNLIKTFYFQSDIMSKWNRKRNHLGRNSSNNERLKIPFVYQSFESLESSSLTKTKDHEMTTTHVFKLESITFSLKKLEKYLLVHNLPALQY